MWRWRRCLETARIWSTTATAGWPAQSKGTKRGGLARGEEESGTTTTVRRRWLTTLAPTTRQRRVLPICGPVAQTSPRRGVMPGLLDVGRESVEVLLDGDEVLILVGKIAGLSQMAVAFGELAGEGLGQIAGAVVRADGSERLLATDGHGWWAIPSTTCPSCTATSGRKKSRWRISSRPCTSGAGTIGRAGVVAVRRLRCERNPAGVP